MICLHALQILVAYLVIHFSEGAITCTDDGVTWLFKKCKWVAPMYFIHVFVTMQTAVIPRVIFIKTAKKTTLNHEFKGVRQEVKRMFWARNALNEEDK